MFLKKINVKMYILATLVPFFFIILLNQSYTPLSGNSRPWIMVLQKKSGQVSIIIYFFNYLESLDLSLQMCKTLV